MFMSFSNQNFSMSQLSLHSSGSPNEDWDRSLNEYDIHPGANVVDVTIQSTTTPRNSVIFPAEEDDKTPGRAGLVSKGKRSLSELLRLQKGTDLQLNAEEASRVADVLGQWINSNSAPYEGDDDFFARSQDDLSLPKRTPKGETNARPRGQSESSVYARPPSSAGT